MDTKKTRFKFLKFFFYFIGFPCLCLTTYILLAPTLREIPTEEIGKKCLMVPFLLWGIVALLKVILKKLSNKGSLKADYATLILVVTTVVLMVVPMFSTDIVLSKQYNEIRAKAATKETATISYVNPIDNSTVTEEIVVYNGIDMPTYPKIMGWAIDNTNKGGSYFHNFISECQTYINNNGLAGYHTATKANAETKKVNFDINLDGVVDDKDEQVLGQQLGLYEDIQFKLKGKHTYTILAAELNGRYNLLLEQQKALALDIAETTRKIVAIQQNEKGTDPSQLPALQEALKKQQETLDNFNKKYSDEIRDLGGQRVRIYKENVLSLLGIIKDAGNILPDGLDITAIGMVLPVGDIVKFLGDIVELLSGINLGNATVVDTIADAICSQIAPDGRRYIEISTGLAKDNQYQTCAKAASGIATSNGYDYTAVKGLDYKLSAFPQLYVFARLRRAMYVFVGIIVISLLLTDHYDRKIAQIDKIVFNENVNRIISEKGYVLATPTTQTTVENINKTEVPLTTPVVDLTKSINTVEDSKPQENKIQNKAVNTKENVKEISTDKVETKDDKASNLVGLDLTKGGNKNEK